MTDEQMGQIMAMVAEKHPVSKLDQLAWRSTLAGLEYGPTVAALVQACKTERFLTPSMVDPKPAQVSAGKFERAEVAWGLVLEGLRACTNEASAFRRLVADTWDPDRPETRAVIEMGRDLLPSSGQTLDQCRWSFMRAYNRHAGISEVAAEPKPVAGVLEAGGDDVAALVAETHARRVADAVKVARHLPIIGRRA